MSSSSLLLTRRRTCARSSASRATLEYEIDLLQLRATAAVPRASERNRIRVHGYIRGTCAGRTRSCGGRWGVALGRVAHGRAFAPRCCCRAIEAAIRPRQRRPGWTPPRKGARHHPGSEQHLLCFPRQDRAPVLEAKRCVDQPAGSAATRARMLRTNEREMIGSRPGPLLWPSVLGPSLRPFSMSRRSANSFLLRASRQVAVSSSGSFR
jgi:hypothetical protein